MDEKIKQTIEEIELVMHNAWGCRYFNTKDMKLNNDRFFNREATAIYNAGYRKESDTAKEICDLILEHWEKKQFVECDWLRVAIAEKYGVDLD